MTDQITQLSVALLRIAELEANELAYERIIGKKSYQEVAEEVCGIEYDSDGRLVWARGQAARDLFKEICLPKAKVCGIRPAQIPDRYKTGTPRKEICRECHADRLKRDLEMIVTRLHRPYGV